MDDSCQNGSLAWLPGVATDKGQKTRATETSHVKPIAQGRRPHASTVESETIRLATGPPRGVYA